MHHYGVFRRLLGCGAGEDEAMTRWGEIKCPRCKEADALVQAAVAAALREAINRVSGCDRISEVQPAILALSAKGESDVPPKDRGLGRYCHAGALP
jgi:hypothetical protein